MTTMTRYAWVWVHGEGDAFILFRSHGHVLQIPAWILFMMTHSFIHIQLSVWSPPLRHNIRYSTFSFSYSACTVHLYHQHCIVVRSFSDQYN